MVEIISDIRCNGNPNCISYGKVAGEGFQYILRHGVGPGTLPSDVGIIREVDLSNFYTVVYLDRVLEADEMKKYEISNEWDNHLYMGGVEL